MTDQRVLSKAPAGRSSDAARSAARYPRFLERLGSRDRDALLARASSRTLNPRALVFAQGEPIDDMLILQSGRVKAYYTTPDGQAITFAYWAEGMLMGMPGMSGTFTHMWTAEALTPTRLLLIRREHFLHLIDTSPSAARCMIEILEFKTKYLSRLAQLLATASVGKRLQIVLASLSDQYGTPGPEGVRIDLPLTHAEIADMVGASRQWVNTSLKQLERAGIISVENRCIVISPTPQAVVT